MYFIAKCIFFTCPFCPSYPPILKGEGSLRKKWIWTTVLDLEFGDHNMSESVSVNILKKEKADMFTHVRDCPLKDHVI